MTTQSYLPTFEGPDTTPLHKALDPAETPTSRVIRDSQLCANHELFSVLIGGTRPIEMAEALVRNQPYLLDIARLSYTQLTHEAGLPPSAAARVRAAIELAKRMSASYKDQPDRPAVHSPADAAALVQFEMSLLEQEELWVINLDTRNRVLEISRLYKGSLNSSQVRVGELFKQAIRLNAANIIVLHNHPSGDPTPSPDDVTVTRQIIQAGKLLDIDTLDHIVIGHDRFVSLKDRGLGF